MTDDPIQTTVRCFRRVRDDGEPGRCGIWLMTRPSGYRGVFYHGDDEYRQAPRYTVEELSEWAKTGKGFLQVVEITPEEALAELKSWPEAQKDAIAVFERHPK